MISEPELVGGTVVPAPRTGDVVAGGTGSSDGPPPTAPARSRRPWLWALGGAVAASAVWAGGLYAYEHRAADLGGYRVSRNLCLDAEFTALGGALGSKNKKEITTSVAENVTLDRSYCDFQLGRKSDGLDYAVSITYKLHKETDPEAEFDALHLPAAGDGDLRRAERVEGLGERAYVLVPAEEFPVLELVVLDGRAVFRVDVSFPYDDTTIENGEERQRGVQALLSLKDHVMADTKALMDVLRRPA
ncbi:hypothetical protein [Streptomyces sp. NPDC055709]